MKLHAYLADIVEVHCLFDEVQFEQGFRAVKSHLTLRLRQLSQALLARRRFSGHVARVPAPRRFSILDPSY